MNGTHPKISNFPGFTMIPRVSHEPRQEVVCVSLGVHPLIKFFENRKALQGIFPCASFVGRRAISSHGRATDLARVSSRHGGEPGRHSEQTLWHGVSIHGQEEHLGRYQRKKGLERLCRSCRCVYFPWSLNLQPRKLGVESEEHVLCSGLQRCRPVHEPFSLALVSFNQACDQDSHTLGPSG